MWNGLIWLRIWTPCPGLGNKVINLHVLYNVGDFLTR